MKRFFKYSLGLLICLVFYACTEDDLIDYPAPAVGDEIVFGASAMYDAGNDDAKKGRTAYGDVNKEGNKIALNWAAGDQIDILCPQAFATKEATYEVQVGTTPDSTSALLNRVTPNKGLQWSNESDHHFYAIYPSLSKLDFTGFGVTNKEIGFVKNTTGDGFSGAVGYLPIIQTDKSKVEKVPPIETIDGKSTYVVAPDMRFAYMIADTEVKTQEAGKGVLLRFHPLVTALEFQITLGTIKENAGTPHKIQLTSAVLSSVDGSDICGMFKCQKNAQGLAEIIDANPAEKKGQHNQVTVDIPHGVVLNKDTTSCNVTFFLLPTSKIKANDLRLKIFYELNGNIQFKSCKIGVDIQPRKKYFFRDLRLPPIDMKVDGSIWFSAIEDNILMSQVSIPCAGNAFSNYSPNAAYKQQVHDYITLWKQGVRGFEFINQTNPSANTLENQPFVCAENELTNLVDAAGNPITVTFGKAMQALIDLLDTPEYKDEFLIIIARYHPVNDGYVPQRYVDHLLTCLNKWKTKTNADGTTTERFVKLNGNMTTKDLRGKVAVIIRPGDDDCMIYGGKKSTTQDITLNVGGVDWSNNVVLVRNWGSAYDRFDMRYDGFTREATWYDGVNGTPANNPKKRRIEDYLWAVSDGKKGNTNFAVAGHRRYDDVKKDYGENEKNQTLPLFPSPSPKYEHQTTADFTAQIQEWARVIPVGAPYSEGNGVYTGYSADFWWGHRFYRHLWVKWPPSIGEKKASIGQLFNLSVNRKQNGMQANLFINVMSGYYPSIPTGTVGSSKSVMPFKYNFDLDWDDWTGGTTTEDVVQPQGQGNDGNYAALAAELNRYLFNLLARRVGTDGTPAGPQLQEGPYGLIVMDFIGATAADYKACAETAHPNDHFNAADDANYEKAAFASRALVYMIMMNNFKFPMDKNTQGQVNQDVVVDQSKDEVVAE